MNATGNGTRTSGIEYSDRGQLHDLVYVLATLLVATLSAIVVSFLGRRQLFARHEPATMSSIHSPRSGPYWLRKDEVRV